MNSIDLMATASRVFWAWFLMEVWLIWRSMWHGIILFLSCATVLCDVKHVLQCAVPLLCIVNLAGAHFSNHNSASVVIVSLDWVTRAMTSTETKQLFPICNEVLLCHAQNCPNVHLTRSRDSQTWLHPLTGISNTGHSCSPFQWEEVLHHWPRSWPAIGTYPICW